MNKKEYLKRLEKALRHVSTEERARTLSYYSEVIDDRIEEGIPEQQVIAELEPPEAVASGLRQEGVIHTPAKKSPNTGLIVGVTVGALLLLALIIFPIVAASRQPGHSLWSSGKNPAETPVVTPSGSQDNASGQNESITVDCPAGTLISIDLIASNLELIPSPDDSFHLSYINDDYYKYEVVEGKNPATLTFIEKTRSSGFFSFVGRVSYSRTVTLSVPLSAGADVNASTVSGDIKARNLDMARISLDTVSGEIDVISLSCGGEFAACSTSGDIDLTGCSLSSITTDTVSGSMELENTSFSSLNFNSVSGDLEGDLVGSPDDYAVHFSTTSGRNSLRNLKTNGPIMISFSSVSGDLDLEFEHYDLDD